MRRSSLLSLQVILVLVVLIATTFAVPPAHAVVGKLVGIFSEGDTKFTATHSTEPTFFVVSMAFTNTAGSGGGAVNDTYDSFIGSLESATFVSVTLVWKPDASSTVTCTQAWTPSEGEVLYTCAGSFADVSGEYWAFPWIEALYDSEITSGCSTDPLMYCPEDPVSRAQVAVFLERGMHGSEYSPPSATGSVFVDVSADYWAADWIEQLYADGITAGCSSDPLMYCPEDPVSRAQMSVFLERGMHWPDSYSPPTGTGTLFGDVSGSHWAVDWIEQLYADGITSGCSADPLLYCPEDEVTRAQMAVFLVRSFELPMP
jgi:hypothetical protein